MSSLLLSFFRRKPMLRPVDSHISTPAKLRFVASKQFVQILHQDSIPEQRKIFCNDLEPVANRCTKE